MKLPAAVDTRRFPFRLDTREPRQHPWNVHPFPVVRATLPFGDGTLSGFERELVFERKTLTDLVGCCGRSRQRFEKVVTGLLGHRLPFLVVEADWYTVESGGWPGDLKPSHVIGALVGWECRGIHLLMAGSAERAGTLVARICYMHLRRAWDRARDLVAAATECEWEAAVNE